MITAEKALSIVITSCKELQSEQVDVVDSLNRILAEDVLSLIDMPPFPQSAMDGYAVNYSVDINQYEVIGEIAAGDTGKNINLSRGECVRIFTGAIVPLSANVVIKQEDVEPSNDTIKVISPAAIGTNIRPKGEQIQVGDLALEKGTMMSPAGVGFLLGLGITEIEVFQKPKITIIATGNELIKPGEKLPEGKIYESNSYMLSAALQQYGYSEHNIVTIGDSYEESRKTIEKAFSQSEVLIISGGISVGDYDFVGKALIELGVKQEFYKVKQKPGKPLFFGTLGNKKVFALPGNPAAAMTSFYIYVLTGIDRMSGISNPRIAKTEMPISKAFHKKGDRAQFLKAKIIDKQVEILEGQSSAMLKSFAISNALVYIPSNVAEVKIGESVTTYLIG